MTETIAALQADPTLARFEFRARNHWVSGGENRSTVKEFYGAGAEDASRGEPFTSINGEPPVLLGHNEGANPVEFLLHALAGCVTTTTVLHAAARGIEIRTLTTRLVGDLDVQGLLGLRDVPQGYREIRIEMDITAANASDEELDDLLQFAQAHSPVCNTICARARGSRADETVSHGRGNAGPRLRSVGGPRRRLDATMARGFESGRTSEFDPSRCDEVTAADRGCTKAAPAAEGPYQGHAWIAR